MKCDRCNDPVEAGEERDFHGRSLCEDCYMDALSPARTCDPWSVHSAQTLKEHGETIEITDIQKKILRILEETGGIEPGLLVERLQIKPSDLEREIAALRHMERLRGELRDGKKVVCLW